MSRKTAPKIKKNWIVCALLLIIVLGGWILLSRSGTIDPDAIAEAETRMWQAYYGQDRLELGKQLIGMLRSQWGFSVFEAKDTGQQLAKASMTFSKVRGDYDRLVLVDLISVYTKIKKITGRSFDPEAAARAELAWWVARRTPGENSSEQVGEKIAELYAVLYGGHHPVFKEAGRLRAEAATLRDSGGKNADWIQIEALLKQSYGQLAEVW